METTTASEPRPRAAGRPSRGTRVELKLRAEPLAQVHALVGTLGVDRSEVLAVLVQRGLACVCHQRAAG